MRRGRAGSTSSGSVAEPVTGAGRVCGTSASSAPSVTTSSTPSSCASSVIAPVKARQLRFGSIPSRRTASRSGAGERRVEEGRLGPVDAPRHAVDERHVRPRHLEVVELLRVDVGEALGGPGLREVAECERGALRPVVPAAEGGDQHRTLELGPLLDAEVSSDSRSLGKRGPVDPRPGRARAPRARRCPSRRRSRARRGSARATRAGGCATASRRRPSARAGARG